MAADPEQIIMPLFAEELALSRRRIDTVVRVSRKTVTSERQVDEELSHAHVVVERVAIDRTVESVPPVREEGETIVFPVVEEEVVVTRRLVLKEEVRVTRVRKTGRHVATIECREQQATVTRTVLDTQPDLTRIHSMTEEIIVAVFDTEAHAEAAIRDLRAADVAESAISRHAGGRTVADPAPVAGYSPHQPVQEQGFWASLFGGEPDHDTAVYDRSIASGSTVVTVRTIEGDYERVMEVLERHHPVDIDERADGYGLGRTGTVGTSAMEMGAMRADTMQTGMAQTGTAQAGTMQMGTAASSQYAPGVRDDAEAMQLSEEQLSIGKRVVNRGGTRIRRFVVETPVEEQVTLRDEKVTVERRPVTDGRTVAADFSDKTIEMTESTEEAVVSKSARVVEEIALRKQASDRVETVRDTVRREDIAIEQVPGVDVTPRPIDPALRSPKI